MPRCGGALLEKEGRFGPFVGCSRYPNCKYVFKGSEPPEQRPPDDYGSDFIRAALGSRILALSDREIAALSGERLTRWELFRQRERLDSVRQNFYLHVARRATPDELVSLDPAWTSYLRWLHWCYGRPGTR